MKEWAADSLCVCWMIECVCVSVLWHQQAVWCFISEWEMKVLIIKWSLISCRRVPLPIPQENLPVTGIPRPSGPRPIAIVPRSRSPFNLDKTAKLQFKPLNYQEKEKERVLTCPLRSSVPSFFLTSTTIYLLLCRSNLLFPLMGVTLTFMS